MQTKMFLFHRHLAMCEQNIMFEGENVCGLSMMLHAFIFIKSSVPRCFIFALFLLFAFNNLTIKWDEHTHSVPKINAHLELTWWLPPTPSAASSCFWGGGNKGGWCSGNSSLWVDFVSIVSWRSTETGLRAVFCEQTSDLPSQGRTPLCAYAQLG